jgi:hypothetical protein
MVEDFVARLFVTEDYSEIKAEGGERPDEVEGGFRPDFTARGRDGKQSVIGEVETDESLDEQHTADQLRAFHRHAVKNSMVLYLGVPRASKEKAERLCRSIGVVATVITYP